MAMRNVLAVAATALLMMGCGDEKPMSLGQQPFHIASVEVAGPVPEDASEEQLSSLREMTATNALRVPETANPRLLRLRIKQYHKKNPGMSLLVGDANHMTVVADLMDMSGTSTMQSAEIQVNSDSMVNGVIGAVVAAGANDSKIQNHLNAEAADAIMEKIYGKKVWKSWSARR
jgi:hypothetical protein